MAVYQGNPLGNLALGLASLRQPGLLSQAIERKAQAPLLAQQAQLGQLQLEQARQQMEQRQRQAQGMERAQGLLGFDPSSMQGAALPQEQLNRQLGSALLQGGQVPAAMGLLAPKPEKYTKDIQAYKEAIGTGIIPPGTSFEQFIGMVKKPLIQQTTGEKPYSVEELRKLQLPSGEIPPLGTTPTQAGALGVTIREKPMAAETAGKQAMIETAKTEIAPIENILFPEGVKGPINQGAIMGAAIKTGAPTALQPLTGMVSEEGQTVAAGMELGIQAITRIETGAAMPPAEVDNTRKRFQPMPWDHDNVKRQKWTAYKLFLDNASKYLDPNAAKTGNWAVNFEKAMNDAKKVMSKPRKPLSSFERP